MKEATIARGPLAVAVVDGELPDDRLAVVHLGEAGPLARFIVVSAMTFDDIIYLRALGAAMDYERTNPNDVGRVAITLFRDGRKHIESDQNGIVVGSHTPVAERSSGRNLMAKEILERAAKASPTAVPGVGLARVVNLAR